MFSSSLGARGLPTKKSETICRLPWNYSFLQRTLKWACCCDCPEQSIGIYSLGSSLKCVGLEYKPWYRDRGREFKDLAPSSHSCNFFPSLYTLYMWVCYAFQLPITFLRLFFVFQFFFFALNLSFTMKFLSFWLYFFPPAPYSSWVSWWKLEINLWSLVIWSKKGPKGCVLFKKIKTLRKFVCQKY